MSGSDITVLLVEDNDFDVKRVQRGFQRLGDTRQILRARDGIEALEILRNPDLQARSAHRMVVMLDLNMPRMGGLEFLDAVRADQDLRVTPVFVVTTSDYHLDIDAAHDRMISGYFIKPDTADEMVSVLKTLSEFWDKSVYAD